jgi:hypothetical protein
MLAYLVGDAWVVWQGEEVAGVMYPMNIGSLPQSTDEVLAGYGLRRITRFLAPAGKTKTGQPAYVLQEDGTVQETYEVIDEEPVVRTIGKSVVLSRLTDAQLDAALGLMTNRQKERWRAPDNPAINVDDPELLGLLSAIGADPDVVLV